MSSSDDTKKTTIPKPKVQRPKPGDKIIWQFWHDMSSDNAPHFYFKFMELMNPGWRQIIIENKTIYDYLDPEDLPKNFSDLEWNKVAQKADIIRVAALLKYGGIYADATIVPLTSFDNVWNILQSNDKLTYYGCKNKAPVKGGFEYSVFWFAAKHNSPVLQEWHNLQMFVLKDLLENPVKPDLPKNFVYERHPMYLDFGDQCLKTVIPKMKNSNSDTFTITHITGCWQNELEMGEYDWKLYNGIVDLLLDKSLKIRHAHYFRGTNEKVPYFVKLHRGGSVKPELLKTGLRDMTNFLPVIDDKTKKLMRSL